MATHKVKHSARPAQPQPVPHGAYAAVAAFNNHIEWALANLATLLPLQTEPTGAAAVNLLQLVRAQVCRNCLLTLVERESNNAGYYDAQVIADEQQR